MPNINEILASPGYAVSSKYGAPMGRADCIGEPAPVTIERVGFVDGDYDAGGAYWGGGERNLWAAYNEDTMIFFRADSRESAEAEAAETLGPDFPIVPDELADLVEGYLRALLFAAPVILPVGEDELVDGCMDVDDEHPLYDFSEGGSYDDRFEVSDCTDDLVSAARDACAEFVAKAKAAGIWDDLTECADSLESIGHDIYFESHGCGVGFTDRRYYSKETAEAASAIGDEISGFDVWVTEEGRIETM